MRVRFSVLAAAAALVCLAGATSAQAQSNAFRDSRSHIGVGLGYFTYYGPVDLGQPVNGPGNDPKDGNNRITNHDPAVVVLGTFPLRKRGWFFRGLVGVTNLDHDWERTFTQPPVQNEFLRQTLFFFEPELVWAPTAGGRSRVLPYVYSGFGGLVANPFNAPEQVNVPGQGSPGPDRSVFVLPLGAGVDIAITRLLSVWVDASYRFNFNYVANNAADVQGPNPHDTSLLMGGLRLGLERRRRVRVYPEPPPLPPAADIPTYEPPIARPVAPPKVCSLVELNTIYFNIGSVNIAGQAEGLLDSNVEALRLGGACCLEIVGVADPASREDAMQVSQQRARAVYDYYVRSGIDPSRLRMVAGGAGTERCSKGEGPGCPPNRRVETRPVPCEEVRGRRQSTVPLPGGTQPGGPSPDVDAPLGAGDAVGASASTGAAALPSGATCALDR